jgi:hypothetical protein
MKVFSYSNKVIFYSVVLIAFLITACGEAINRVEITGCWSVAYIDTDGVKVKAGEYQMCFEENGVLISERKNGKEKIKAEWNFEENDSTIVIHYKGSSMPDTAKIIKFEDGEEMHLRIKKMESYVTLYLRKEK